MFDTIKRLISEELGIEEDQITPETDFFNDLHCDSLELIELMSTVEETFNIEEIPEENLGQFKTVNDLISYLEENVEK